MAGFEDGKFDMEVEVMDADATDADVYEDEDFKGSADDSDDQDEFDDDDDLDSDFNPGAKLSLDSVEIDVEQLLTEIAAEASATDAANVRVRKRLEAMLERKRRHQAFIDFDEYDLEG